MAFYPTGNRVIANEYSHNMFKWRRTTVKVSESIVQVHCFQSCDLDV